MDTNGPDDLLKRIARVDPPPFLLTRIEARLAEGKQVPRGRLVAVACALALLLLVNLAVLTHGSGSGSRLDEVAKGMGMNTSNQLYE
jgi:hypothetical protein